MPQSWHKACVSKAMKTAFSVWDQRIAPVFDTAPQVQLVESEGARIRAEKTHLIPGDAASQKVAWLTEKGVETLVCGAVSRPLQERLAAAGIKIVPFVAGELRQVIQASFDGSLRGSAFTMPGCCGRRQGWRGEGRRRCCAKRKTI